MKQILNFINGEFVSLPAKQFEKRTPLDNSDHWLGA